MKTILIGQAPGKNGGKPLWGGKVGDKLRELIGVTEREYAERFERMNIFDRWPGKGGKGDKFPIKRARQIAAAKIKRMAGRRILFVGVATASAFGFKTQPLRWRPFNGGSAAILPHPSGVNRWWNEPSNRREAKRFLKTFKS